MNERSSASASASPPRVRELWGTRVGFILAAVGSAVGLGNMWRFPYRTAEHGGAAFLLFYVVITFLVGIPLVIAEFGMGRSTRQSPIGALTAMAGRIGRPLGYFFVLTGFLILGYYAVIAGWVTRYAIEAILTPWPTDAGAYFTTVSSGIQPVLYHLGFMALTIFVVSGGVKGGIERLNLVGMPALFLIIVGLVLWATTLPGAGAGYSFYLSPSVAELLSLDTLAAAASQAFFSLSLGMGAMLTFASYLPRESNLPREGLVIAASDFTVAFLAGLVVFPVIFALGLEQAVSESSVGALFISLPGAFTAMGATGRIVGIFFFVALFFGAITSAVSLLEVVTSSVIDRTGMSRRKAALLMGGIIAALGILPARDINVLGAMDAVASEIFLPLGGLAIAILAGWLLRGREAEFFEGASPFIRSLSRGWIWTLRLVVPPLLIIVLYTTIPGGIAAIRTIFGAG
ncbi:MAG TPA: sodium-dependent transporter [Longimicrobiales bacterium]|nr:sodium-dependent transporter [Longimicrobiales bacterium]